MFGWNRWEIAGLSTAKRRRGVLSDVFDACPPPRPRFAPAFADDDGAGGGPGGPVEGQPEAGPQAEEFEAIKARLIAESRKYRKRAQEAEAKLRQLEAQSLSAEEAAEYRRLKNQAAQYERLLAGLTEKHSRELAEANRRCEQLAGQLQKVLGADRLKSALAARGVTRVDQAAYLLQRHIRVELADGEPVVRVVDADGQPIAAPDGADGQTISVERFVDAWLASDGAHFLPPSGDVGSGAYKGGSAGTVDMAELEADPNKRYAFIREHGTEAYLRRLGQWKRRRAAQK